MRTIRWLTFATVADELNFDAAVDSKDSYTAKYHYTQALWRASDYVGCGVGTKDMGNGATCYMQVCRYQKPGNCAINQDNHIMRMLSDSSGCAGVDVSC